MADCLAVHGISDYEYYDVVPSLANPADSRIVINKWSEDNAGTQAAPFKYRIWSTSNPGLFDMVPAPGGGDYGDWTSELGKAGQNSTTPSEKVFFTTRF